MLLGGSCQLVEDLDRLQAPDWQPSVALPLIDTRLTVGDILDQVPEADRWLRAEADGSLTFFFRSEYPVEEVVPLLDLPDIALPVVDTAMQWSVSSLPISLAHLSGGSLAYHFTWNDPDGLVVTLHFPDIHLDGQPLETVLKVAGAGEVSGEISLAGATLLPDAGVLHIGYTAQRSSDGSPVQLTDLVYIVTGLAYSYVEGHFGEQSFDLGTGHIDLPALPLLQDAGLRFADPHLRLLIGNSYGVPVRIEARSLVAVDADSQTYPLVAGQTYDLQYPALHEAGQSRQTVITFDRDNSGLAEALAAGPVQLAWDFGAQCNPGGDDSFTGFAFDSSHFDLAIEAELPLHFSLQAWVLRDTFAVDMQDWETDLLRSAHIHLQTDNLLPLDVALQVVFCDAEGLALDSLFGQPQQILAGGSGSTPGQTALDIDLSPERMAGLRATRSVCVRATLATTGSKAVHIRPEQTLGLRLGILAGIDL
ncbi:MAG: hypothetical protein OHK0039_10610 [Bacteroidia bacterium]